MGSDDFETEVKSQLKDLHAKFDLFLHGNFDKPGLMIRMDRLEQDVDRRKWHLGIIYTALVGVAVKFIQEWFGRTK